MSIKPAEKFRFSQWLPDQADLDNPGVTEASNVLWTAGNYVPYQPLVTTGFQLPGGIPVAAFRATGLNSTSGLTNNTLFVASNDGSGRGQWISASTGNSFNFQLVEFLDNDSNTVNFTQYGNTVIYTDGATIPQSFSTSTPVTAASLGGPFGFAPAAYCVGIIGQFVVLGNLPAAFAPTSLQWSGINQPFNWPTPQSADAIAQQSGQQFLEFTLGPVMGIAQGDQWGLILTENGLTRVQYVGGDTVFQFDNIYRGPSCIGMQAWAKVGGRIYSCAGDGFIVTDGTSVQRIGNGRVDKWFQNNVGGTPSVIQGGVSYNVQAGVDPSQKLIYWSFPMTGTGNVCNAWIAYNYLEDRWTHGTDGIACFVKGGESWEYVPGYGMEAFASGGSIQARGYGGTLSGTPNTAVITTPEVELNPGGRALLQGFRPQIIGAAGQVPSVRIGSRTRLGDQVIYTPSIAVNGQTNFADALVDANYHRAETTIVGEFNQAIGGEFKAVPSGDW